MYNTHNKNNEEMNVCIHTISGDGCKGNSFKFPLNDGAIYYLPLSCPLKANQELDVKLVAEISDSAPHGQVVATLKYFDQPDQKGNCTICTVTTFTLS